ncbi:MAG: tyrosine-protein phosphatase [Acidimicrobiia bacterium]
MDTIDQTGIAAAEFARRRVVLENLQNFRDLGGYRTASGRTVKWGHLYRADNMARLSPGDVATVSALGVNTVIDLRMVKEIERDGRAPVTDHGIAYHHFRVIDEVMIAQPQKDDAPALGRSPGEMYKLMADMGGKAFAGAIDVLAQPGGLPAVFHCTAGKDRTGMLAALILSGLGVDDDTIADDYVLTALARDEREAFLSQADPVYLDQLKQIPPQNRALRHEAMHMFLGHVRDGYGGVVEYLRQHGLTDGAWDVLSSELLD